MTDAPPASLILLATRSAGKLRELGPLFGRAGLGAIDLRAAGIEEDPEAEEGIESFDTFEENALAKARYFARRTGMPTVADDSGLEVSALGGRPGVRSKRFSGRSDLTGQALDDANNARLLAELGAGVDRSARYVCAAAFVSPDGTEIVRRGETVGRIVTTPRGGDGFGYDPYFESSDLGATFGEVDGPAKEAVSHRGRAFRALIEALSAVDHPIGRR